MSELRKEDIEKDFISRYISNYTKEYRELLELECMSEELMIKQIIREGCLDTYNFLAREMVKMEFAFKNLRWSIAERERANRVELVKNVP